jgi:hypothetical protein
VNRYGLTIVCFAAGGESDAMMPGKSLTRFAAIVWAGFVVVNGQGEWLAQVMITVDYG